MIKPLWAKNDKPETKANRFVQPSTSWYWQKKQVWKDCKGKWKYYNSMQCWRWPMWFAKNTNNKKSDLYISIRSPSQWQLSGSCLPLLRPVVYISANAPSWHTNQSQVRWKIKDFLPQLSNHQQDIIWLGAHWKLQLQFHCEKLRRVKGYFSNEQLINPYWLS